MTYEQAVKRLEEIVKRIEGGEMDIDSLTANLKEAKGLYLCIEFLDKRKETIGKQWRKLL